MNFTQYLGYTQIVYSATAQDWEPAGSAEGNALHRDNADAITLNWTPAGYVPREEE